MENLTVRARGCRGRERFVAESAHFAVPVPPVKRFSRRVSVGAEIPPGPNAGRIWRDAPASHCDPLSGRIVTRLTSYRGHSHHLVGAAPCWLDEGARLVIVSDREGWGNLFAYDFAAGALTQLTDLRGDDRPARVQLLSRDRLGFWYGGVPYELELDTLRMREFKPRASAGTPAGKPVAESVGEATLSDRRRIVWLAGGAGRRDRRVLVVTAGSGLVPYAVTAPCVRPRQEQVLFVSDASGYAQIYAVNAGQPATLPRLSATALARR